MDYEDDLDKEEEHDFGMTEISDELPDDDLDLSEEDPDRDH